MGRKLSPHSESKLANYLASSASLGAAAIATTATEADSAIVANTTPVPFGINEEVNIDFDGNGTIEFQIDHDRVEVNGMDLDYLQIDKNDVSSAENPLASDPFATFPGGYLPNRADYTGDGVGSWDAGDLQAWQNEYGSVNADPENPTFFADGNDDAAINGSDFLIWQQQASVPFSYDQGYITDANEEYPTALTSGTSIGPSDFFTFQETTNFSGLGLAIHANRLIDEDAGAIDTDNGVPAFPISDTPQFVGLGGETRYLGVRFDLDDEGFAGNEFAGANAADGDPDNPANYWYGWIGVQITNEADATGVVTGWAYEDQIGTAINAGDTGVPPASTAVPEPTSIVTAALGGAIATSIAWRKFFRSE